MGRIFCKGQNCVALLAFLICIQYVESRRTVLYYKGSSRFPRNSIVHVESIQRFVKSDSNEFIVIFRKNAYNLKLYVSEPHVLKGIVVYIEPTTIRKISRGVWRATFRDVIISPSHKIIFVSEVGEKDVYTVTFALNIPEIEKTIKIQKNKGTTPDVDDDDEDGDDDDDDGDDDDDAGPAKKVPTVSLPAIPELKMIPTGEVKYVPDLDAGITIFAPMIGENKPSTEYQHTLLDLRTKNLVRDIALRGSECFSEASYESFCEQVIFPISTTQPTGYIFSKVKYDLGSDLIQLHLERSMVLRPTGQEEPFPEDFIKIMGMNELENRDNTCRYGEQCVQGCFVLGYVESDIIVKAIQLDGKEIDIETYPTDYLPPTTRADGIKAYIKSRMWHLLPETLPNAIDKDNILTFKCSVTDEPNDKEISELIKTKI
ncbi:hypothetical protein PoB_000641200, partial [Plakobranchus ocellatus]